MPHDCGSVFNCNLHVLIYPSPPLHFNILDNVEQIVGGIKKALEKMGDEAVYDVITRPLFTMVTEIVIVKNSIRLYRMRH